MHTISNARALAHWRTLCCLPLDKLDLLEERFTKEQPAMARATAELTAAVDCFRESQADLERDPRLSQFGQRLLRGGCLAELFRREAGHPLRPLDEVEIKSILRAGLQEADTLLKSSTPDGPNIFTSSDQPDLLRGILIGHLSVEGAFERESKALMILRFLVQALHQACGDGVPDPPGDWSDWDAERILVALSVQGDPDPMRRAALGAAERFRTELIPPLIKELKSWTADSQAALEEDLSLGLHAMFLLAKWREDSAWPAFRKLFSLPGDIGYDLLGDLITEQAPILFAMVGGRRREELRALIEDEKLDEYCRGACLDALTCLVAWGEMPRQDHASYLRELLTTKLRDLPKNEHVLGCVVSAAGDLEEWELRPEIEAACRRGAVDKAIENLDLFLQGPGGKHPGQWQAFRERHQPMVDIVAATEWLDEPLFRDEQQVSSLREGRRHDPQGMIADSAQPYIAPPKIARNDPCPCGSGRKYKRCCGK